MEKVKVTRYMTGKRPDWAPEEFDSDEELQLQTKKITIKKPGNLDIEKVSFFKCVSPKQQEARFGQRLGKKKRINRPTHTKIPKTYTYQVPVPVLTAARTQHTCPCIIDIQIFIFACLV